MVLLGKEELAGRYLNTHLHHWLSEGRSHKSLKYTAVMTSLTSFIFGS